MKSTMQANQLGLALLLRHACRVNGRSRIVSVAADGRRIEQSFADLAHRAGRRAARGHPLGTVVGPLAGASREHLEAYLGVPASGRILHTINVRLHADDQAYIAEHANEEVVILDRRRESRTIRVVRGTAAEAGGRDRREGEIDTAHALPCETVDYETLSAEGEARIDWPDIDENEAAIICFTGGTTGMPKGVAYSHRSIWLQAMSICTANSVGLSSHDVLLPTVPLYHVNAWGLPFAALMAGCDLVLPGASLQPADLIGLIESEGQTVAAGVPTIWSDVLAEMRERGMTRLGRLASVSCGGAQVPQRLSGGVRRARHPHGAGVGHDGDIVDVPLRKRPPGRPVPTTCNAVRRRRGA
ncbi:Medium-chain-fatty-acid-CoA ligase [Candidatus Paraburkholderia calva]|nr:Medium-chain-fatty-acid-CoA ligase [Candidatus Paraburkholderia calva]